MTSTEAVRAQYRTTHNLDARIALHKHYSVNPQSVFDFAAARYEFIAGEAILEVGCGTGEFWRDRWRTLPRGCKLTLSDLSDGMLERARAALAAATVGFVTADVQRLPFPNAKFDKTLAHFMLYHVPSPTLALEELERVLRPGGAAYIVTVGDDHMGELRSLALAHDPAFPWQDNHVGDFSEDGALAQLQPIFDRVATHIYTDELRVPTTAPVVAYLRSLLSHPNTALRPGFWADLTADLEQRIAAAGAFRISKRCALYVCFKAQAF